jgi:hypothetical protein
VPADVRIISANNLQVGDARCHHFQAKRRGQCPPFGAALAVTGRSLFGAGARFCMRPRPSRHLLRASPRASSKRPPLAATDPDPAAAAADGPLSNSCRSRRRC